MSLPEVDAGGADGGVPPSPPVRLPTRVLLLVGGLCGIVLAVAGILAMQALHERHARWQEQSAHDQTVARCKRIAEASLRRMPTAEGAEASAALPSEAFQDRARLIALGRCADVLAGMPLLDQQAHATAQDLPAPRATLLFAGTGPASHLARLVQALLYSLLIFSLAAGVAGLLASGATPGSRLGDFVDRVGRLLGGEGGGGGRSAALGGLLSLAMATPLAAGVALGFSADPVKTALNFEPSVLQLKPEVVAPADTTFKVNLVPTIAPGSERQALNVTVDFAAGQSPTLPVTEPGESRPSVELATVLRRLEQEGRVAHQATQERLREAVAVLQQIATRREDSPDMVKVLEALNDIQRDHLSALHGIGEQLGDLSARERSNVRSGAMAQELVRR